MEAPETIYLSGRPGGGDMGGREWDTESWGDDWTEYVRADQVKGSVPSSEDFQRWVEEYLYFSKGGISDYYPDMGSYIHDQFVRYCHGGM